MSIVRLLRLLVAALVPAALCWSAVHAQTPVRFQHKRDQVISVAFSHDGKILASAGGENVIYLWDLIAGKEAGQLTGHEGSVYSVAYSPDGKTLASGGMDKTIRLWNPATGKEVSRLTGHDDRVFSIAYGPDGKTLASGSMDKTIRLWNLATGKEAHKLTGSEQMLFSVAYSPDGKAVAAAGADFMIRLWDPTTGKEIRTLTLPQNRIRRLAYSPDGKTLACAASDKAIHLWDAATGKEIRKLNGHEDPPWSVAYAPDGRTLVSGSWDGSVRLWELATGKEVRRLHGQKGKIMPVTFSPDGKKVAAGSIGSTVFVWDLTQWAEPEQPAELADKELEGLWKDLAGDDAAKAHRAMWKLATAPKAAVPFVEKNIPRISPADAQRFVSLIADLDSAQFTVRQKASDELEKLLESVEPSLRQALKDNPSPEKKQRIDRLLERLQEQVRPLSPESFRLLRAIQALELMGDPEARKLLGSIAETTREGRLRYEAKASLDRLSKRSP